MSAHIPCICGGTRKERMKNWYVSLRNANRSYFEYPKGQLHSSAYSTVNCKNCLMSIRSKAKYVEDLPDS